MAGPKRLTTHKGVRLWTIKHAATSKDWKDVAVPNAAFDWVPFTIQTNGYRFRPHPSFNLQEHANIMVSKTYYVDSVNGSDANSGADWDNALRTLDEAWSKADVDRIYATGQWTKLEQNAVTDRDFELIGVGDCKITCDVTDDYVGAWSAVDNHYEATVSDYVYSDYDESDPNADCSEWGTQLTNKASIAEVDANPGSRYQDWGARKLYVRTFDSREPDADLRSYSNIALYLYGNNQTIYLENIQLFPSTYWRSDGVGGIKIYAQNCDLYGGIFYGVEELIFQDCRNTCRRPADIINHNERDAISQNSIEINCDFRNTAESGSSQASTTHNAVSIVRLENYYESGAQVIADSGESSWNLGCHMYNYNAGYGFYTSGSPGAWLDKCYVDGELIENGAGTIYLRKCTVTGAQSGDIQSY